MTDHLDMIDLLATGDLDVDVASFCGGECHDWSGVVAGGESASSRFTTTVFDTDGCKVRAGR